MRGCLVTIPIGDGAVRLHLLLPAAEVSVPTRRAQGEFLNLTEEAGLGQRGCLRLWGCVSAVERELRSRTRWLLLLLE